MVPGAPPSTLEFLEKFAYSESRENILNGLLPGSDEYFFYNGLHALQKGEFSEAERILNEMEKELKNEDSLTPLLDELRCRVHLCRWQPGDKNEKTLDYLKEVLSLDFEDYPEPSPGAPSVATWPSTLPADKAEAEYLLAGALKEHGLKGLNKRAYSWAIPKLTVEQLRELLQDVKDPTLPGLVDILLKVLSEEPFSEDLASRYPVFQFLTVEQLEAIQKARPDIGSSRPFVRLLAKKLLPPTDPANSLGDDELLRYHERLEKAQLLGVAPWLREKVLYEKLVIGRRRGQFSAPLLKQYLEASLGKDANLQDSKFSYFPADSDFSTDMGYEDTGNLVDDYFRALFAQSGPSAFHAETFQPLMSKDKRVSEPPGDVPELTPWLPLIRQGALEWARVATLLAEAKILSGEEPSDKWFELLRRAAEVTCRGSGESAAQSLAARVDILFAPSNPQFWGVAEAVDLEVVVKNVRQLTVKLFEINTWNFYTESKQMTIPDDIDLDGLSPGHEEVISLDATSAGNAAPSPMKQLKRTLRFPQLAGRRGCFVVELVGNGSCSRAIIRKGSLRLHEQPSDAGQVLTVVREDGSTAGTSGRVYVDGREYACSGEGEALIPFALSTDMPKVIFLSDGELTCPARWQHCEESYKLEAGMWLDSQAMVADATVPFLLQPLLLLSNRPVPLQLLQEPTLVVEWCDLDSVQTSRRLDINAPELEGNREVVRRLRVPSRGARSLKVTLSGFVTRVSRKEGEEDSTVPLSVSHVFSPSAFVSNRRGKLTLEGLYLRQDAGGFHASILGPNGEPLEGRHLTVHLRHQGMHEAVSKAVQLQSDAQGECHLGLLPEVEGLTVKVLSGGQLHWELASRASVYKGPASLVGQSGKTLRIPFGGASLGRQNLPPVNPLAGVALLELNCRKLITADITASHAVAVGGWLELGDLPAGNFILHLPTNESPVDIQVLPGPSVLAAAPEELRPLTIHEITELPAGEHGLDDRALEIKLGGSGPTCTRVHVAFSHMVMPSHFQPMWTSLESGPNLRQVDEGVAVGKARSSYLVGRRLSDEVRYVLERRQLAGRRPGVMLPRPSLLLQPRATQNTETNVRQSFFGRGLGQPSSPPYCSDNIEGVGPYRSCRQARRPFVTSQDDGLSPVPLFNPTPLLLTNLRPNEEGVIRIPLSNVPACHTFVHITAVDTGSGTCQVVAAEWSLASPEPLDLHRYYRDARLAQGLNPDHTFAEQRSVTGLQPGKDVVVEDMSTSKIQIYDTLEKAAYLLESLLAGEAEHAKWQKLEFVPKWADLSAAQKVAKLAKMGCHELHLFLYMKDPPFFEQHVLPALQAKMNKSFMDSWLVGDFKTVLMLGATPYVYGQLNAAEKGLLVFSLAKEGRVDEAQAVVRDIEDWSASVCKSSPEESDRLFKTALGAGVLETFGGGGEDSSESNRDGEMGGTLDEVQGGSGDEGGSGELSGWEMLEGGEVEELQAMENSMLAYDTFKFAGPPQLPPPPPPPLPPTSMFGNVHMASITTKSLGGAHNQMKKKVHVRGSAPQLYTPTSLTREYVETYYLENRWAMDATTIPPSPFWSEFASHALTSGQASSSRLPPFLSTAFPEGGAGTFTASMICLALLQLPFPGHQQPPGPSRGPSAAPMTPAVGYTLDAKGSALTISPSWPAVLFLQELRQCPPPKPGSVPTVLLRQSLYDCSKDNVESDASVRNSLAPGTDLQVGCVYELEAVVANVGSERKALTLLMQIPQGAVPLLPAGQPTQTLRCQLAPYQTSSFRAQFYFPSPGEFCHLPVQASQSPSGNLSDGSDGEVLAVASGAATWLCVISKEEADRRKAETLKQEGWGKGPDAWPAISQLAPLQEVTKFLSDENLRQIDLEKLSWRLKQRESFEAIRDVFKRRKIFDLSIWAYSVYHGNQEALQEFLPACKDIIQVLAYPVLESPLLRLEETSTFLVDPFNLEFSSWRYRYLEYNPLVNNRAHDVGGAGQFSGALLNKNVKEQYITFLQICARLPHLSQDHYLQGAYYLLLQDRVEEAEQLFKQSLDASSTHNGILAPSKSDRAEPGPSSPAYRRLVMQSRYMAAYLDMCSDSRVPLTAYQVAAEYADCQVVQWRSRFLELSRQLQDIDQYAEGMGRGKVAQQGRMATSAEKAVDASRPGGSTSALVKAQETGTVGQEAMLELREEAGRLLLEHAGVPVVGVGLYEMDVELLFSANPFMQHNSEGYTYIIPNWTSQLALTSADSSSQGTPGMGVCEVALPEKFAAKNVLIEVQGGGLRRTCIRYSQVGLWVEVREKVGHVRVWHRQVSPTGPPSRTAAAATSVPVPKAYVKVYRKGLSGSVAFYKDGYTDRRGLFDYAASSSDDVRQVARFAILVVSDQYGALVREADSPAPAK